MWLNAHWRNIKGMPETRARAHTHRLADCYYLCVNNDVLHVQLLPFMILVGQNSYITVLFCADVVSYIYIYIYNTHTYTHTHTQISCTFASAHTPTRLRLCARGSVLCIAIILSACTISECWYAISHAEESISHVSCSYRTPYLVISVADWLISTTSEGVWCRQLF